MSGVNNWVVTLSKKARAHPRVRTGYVNPRRTSLDDMMDVLHSSNEFDSWCTWRNPYVFFGPMKWESWGLCWKTPRNLPNNTRIFFLKCNQHQVAFCCSTVLGSCLNGLWLGPWELSLFGNGRCQGRNHQSQWSIYGYIWRLPEIGVPLFIIHFYRILPRNKNYPFGVPPWLWKPHGSLNHPNHWLLSRLFWPNETKRWM